MADALSPASKAVTPSAEMLEVLVDGARYGDLDDVRSALQCNIDVNATDDMGRSGWGGKKGFAAKFISPQQTKIVLVAAALLLNVDVPNAIQDVDVRNAEGNTPLHWACLNGCGNVTRVLLGYGASPSTLNSHSNTPVDELLGKPYQDDMLALIESYQEQQRKTAEVSTSRRDPIGASQDVDEFDGAEQT